MKIEFKVISVIIFFIAYIFASYYDLTVSAIFHSNNEGRVLFVNIVFFLIGYILPIVGIIVSALFLILSQRGKAASTSEELREELRELP